MPTYLQFKNGTPHYVRDNAEVNEPLQYQPYRTTPLILPGAKVKKDVMPTESYLRHHPNPAVRAAPSHDYHDVLMKQKVADSVLHRVVGEDAASGKVAHRQFNSPIGLYSDSNIENTIRQTVPYKRTVVYDPSKSETYRAVQEEGYGDRVTEIPVPVQTKVFHPNRMVPGKKPVSPRPIPHPNSGIYSHVNTMGHNATDIPQSGSFKRLMYSVLGETDY
ncbi:uncharacterized protein LOC119647941 isoform X9 [Hermetia illucens]|uniref:uncharacterized protein LOC119647941 isoform X9 n=1 Tax=Hermetia illucens TaxID=343691 RepID=UPI0018CC122C|nr:uncharacterized protein LOC119647941 isoform X9 [Hermetia illucens]